MAQLHWARLDAMAETLGTAKGQTQHGGEDGLAGFEAGRLGGGHSAMAHAA